MIIGIICGFGGSGLLMFDGVQSAHGINIFDKNIEINSHNFGYFSFKGANRFDYGLTSGISLNAYGINVSANYDFGLGKVFDTDPIRKDSHNIKNRVFWVGLGYNFKVSK